MANYRLRGAMLNAELTVSDLARIAGVDPKSVWRWLDEDRVPHPITRHRVARALDQRETVLWPQLLDGPSASGIAAAELDRIWLARSAIPTQAWLSLFNRASKQLNIWSTPELVQAGLDPVPKRVPTGGERLWKQDQHGDHQQGHYRQ